MMCGGCVARIKSILSSDDRVDSVAVNMLTETAAVKIKSEGIVESEEILNNVAQSLGKRLTECGFEAKRRVPRLGVAENVKKWKEMAKKKEELLVKSRNPVAFAWILVALCCGSHTSHIFHSLGIHVALGSLWEVLHNSYVKGGFALGALFGPGRDLLFDGLRAFKKGSANMNSLGVFGCIASFLVSSDGPLRIEASSTGSNSMLSKMVSMVEEAQGREAPIQRLADAIPGPFVYSVMTISGNICILVLHWISHLSRCFAQ